MNILFICGSLEPGRDGVGDYTRRLAGELIRQGHEAAIIALNDKAVKEITKEMQADAQTEIKVLRFPASLKWNARIPVAQSFVEDKNPEWLSLQFVPFAFQDKGLPFGLACYLKELGKGRKWYIMFHELWVGAETGSSFKAKILGQFQKYIIKNLVKRLGAKCIQTTIALNQLLLKEQLHIQNSLLPLFSNISFIPVDKVELKNIIPSEIFRNRNRYFIAVNFGNYYVNSWNLQEFIPVFENYCDQKNKLPVMVSLGKNGSGQKDWDALARLYPHIFFVSTGFLSDVQVAGWLQYFTDLGIITTPALIAGKSGSFMAFREHGIPVVAKKNQLKMPFPLPTGMIPEEIIQVDNNRKGEQLTIPPRKEVVGHLLSTIGDRFIKQLNYCK